MNIKQLIDWRKILIFAILIIITSVIENFGFGIWWSGADIGANYGFPLNFYGAGGGPAMLSGQTTVPSYFDYVSLIMDIIIWYFISFFIVFVYDKLRRKK